MNFLGKVFTIDEDFMPSYLLLSLMHIKGGVWFVVIVSVYQSHGLLTLQCGVMLCYL